MQSRMDDALKQLYEQAVPEAVREYLDSKAAPAPKPKRTAKAATRKRRSVSQSLRQSQ